MAESNHLTGAMQISLVKQVNYFHIQPIGKYSKSFKTNIVN